MNKSLRGENDNYHYRFPEETSIEEQLDIAKKALTAVIELSKNNNNTKNNNSWEAKKLEIKKRIQQLEKLIQDS